MARGGGFSLGLPDFGELLPVVVLAGGAYVLLVPGPDGTSLVQKFGNAVAGANSAASAIASFNIPAFGGGPTTPGPANGTGDSFNINTDQSVSWIRWLAGGAVGAFMGGAHIGFGHVGNGGNFVCRLWTQSSGLFGLGGTQPIKIGEKQFNCNADASWTGYGVDFDAGPIAGPGSGWFTGTSLKFWADIVDVNGNLYNQAQIATF